MRGRLTKNSWILTKPIAHRGLTDENAVENSKLAYEQAIKSGFPIEMDVQITKDGVAVCFHDDNLKRVTGVDKNINDVTYNELCTLTLGGTEQKIMTFEQFLDFVNGQVPLMIELKMQKSKQYDVAKIALDHLKNYKGEYAVQSFDPRIVIAVKKYAPWVIRGQLGGIKDRGNVSFLNYVMCKYMPLNFIAKPDFINCNIHVMPKKFNRPVIVWTVQTEDQLAQTKDWKVNCIFENVRP